MILLSDTVDKLHLVGPANEQALNHLGIKTIRDLLYHFPRDWQDLSEIKTITETRPGEKISIKAQVKQIATKRFRYGRMTVTEALLEDSSGNIVAVWFNQPFVKNSVIAGREYYFHGKGQIYGKNLQLSNPAFELVKPDTIHTAGLIPAYELTAGITQKQIRYWLSQALESVSQISDYLPANLKSKHKFLSLPEAIKTLHFPSDETTLKEARRRLAFDELFLLQLAFQSQKKKLATLESPIIAFDESLIRNFVKSLPFELTPSQRLAAWEILQNLSQNHPMNRLLEGEVGSGKTVVAGLAMLATARAGQQSVLLAPTEILAWQHYQTLEKLFKKQMDIALLTRSHKVGTLTDIGRGETKVIIGTHALLQEHVKFDKIGLVVVDEQHRFGVAQRARLVRGQNADDTPLVPHLLSMTATPIPRTLSLAFYGDLDISMLQELPRGRKKIITKLVRPDGRDIAYKFVKQELKKGFQAYVVVPLVEESDKLGAKSVTTEVENLKKIFPEFSIGFLHGRMSGEEKKSVMQGFKDKNLQILVSTTVIEVGVDVPNATIMIIENAER